MSDCHPCVCTPERSCAAHFDVETEIWHFECQDCGLQWLSVWDDDAMAWIRALDMPVLESGCLVCVKFPAGVWELGVVVGEIPGDEGEEFRRLNVTLDDGRELRGCHPGCVRREQARDTDNARWIYVEHSEFAT